jgi:hypothetical protein
VGLALCGVAVETLKIFQNSFQESHPADEYTHRHSLERENMKRKKGDKILVWVVSSRAGISEVVSKPAVVVSWGDKRVAWVFEAGWRGGSDDRRCDHDRDRVAEDPVRFSGFGSMVTGRLLGDEWSAMQLQLTKSFLESEMARYKREKALDSKDGRWPTYMQWRVDGCQKQAASLGLSFDSEGKLQKV